MGNGRRAKIRWWGIAVMFAVLAVITVIIAVALDYGDYDGYDRHVISEGASYTQVVHQCTGKQVCILQHNTKNPSQAVAGVHMKRFAV